MARKKSKSSQTAKILRFLESGKVLTVTEAKNRYGVQKVSARIRDLRTQGYKINTVTKPVRNGGTVTGYQLS